MIAIVFLALVKFSEQLFRKQLFRKENFFFTHLTVQSMGLHQP